MTQAAGKIKTRKRRLAKDVELQKFYRGAISVRARRWANSLFNPPSVLEVASFARRYRNQMFRLIREGKERPPCLTCKDLTIYYCGEVGTECRNFETYCTARLN